MAATRASTGNSKPRKIVQEVAAAVKAPTKKRAAPKKSTTKKATTANKANTSKPRSKVSADKVKKPTVKKAPAKSPAKKPVVAKKVTAPKKTATPKVSKAIPREEPAKVHHKSEPTLLEKMEGAFLHVQGVLTGKSGKKAAGTAKLKGTAPKKTTTKITKK